MVVSPVQCPGDGRVRGGKKSAKRKRALGVDCRVRTAAPKYRCRVSPVRGLMATAKPSVRYVITRQQGAASATAA